MEDDKCTTPRCRGTAEIEYKGKNLCGKCWDKLCDQEAKPEARPEQRPEAKGQLVYNQDHKTIEKAYQTTIEQTTDRPI